MLFLLLSLFFLRGGHGTLDSPRCLWLFSFYYLRKRHKKASYLQQTHFFSPIEGSSFMVSLYLHFCECAKSILKSFIWPKCGTIDNFLKTKGLKLPSSRIYSLRLLSCRDLQLRLPNSFCDLVLSRHIKVLSYCFVGVAPSECI